MNYRHAFHAGNFADLVKHAALLWLLKQMQAPGDVLRVIDTHGGSGLYDLR
ncbi:MAG TPA: 23S rRNA (adenine(2030)-N(6))-methyltransferase RlmJ, partial [Phenylobacterium sp.]|nr:23S rRNA (adenine(2030)-N(6))-methyltransferase RlmJ [Phenylobacterium sp.]